MRIFGFQVYGFKGIRAVEVELDPDGNLVVVTGKNGAGKSSVLDGLWAALSGKAVPQRPIHDGESEASVSLDLGDYIVHRRFTQSGAKLTVEARDGARYRRAQELLDGFVGALSFDPLGFTNLKARDQVAALLDVVDLPFDPAALDDEYRETFEQRTVTNRMVKELSAQVDAIPLAPDGTPDEEVAVADLAREYAAAQEAIAERSRRTEAVLAARDAESSAADEVARLEAALEAARAGLVQRTVDREGAEALLAVMPSSDELMAARDDVQARLAEVDEVNAAVRAKRQRAEQVDRLTLLEATAEEQNERLAAIQRQREEGIAQAAMPVPGLGFTEEGVTYNGVPYSQCSTAEQIKVAVGIAMAANPRLRVLRIAEGGLLDADTLAVIESMAGENDYQVFVEVVNLPGGDLGCQTIEIVDGHLATDGEG